MDTETGAGRLRTSGWLSLMPEDFAAAILDLCIWKRFKASQPLYAAGDPPGGIFGIATGTISYTAALGSPDSPMLHVGRGVVWTGLGPLLSGQPRRASIVAGEPVLAAYAPLEPLQAMLAAHPVWWKHIAQQLLIEFDVVTTMANDLMIRSATRRCAATLLRLADCRFGENHAAAPTSRITQEALADMINLSRSSTGAILRQLEAGGLLSVSYRSVKLHKVEALRLLADAD